MSQSGDPVPDTERSEAAMGSRLGQFGQISRINDHLYLSGVQPLRADRLKELGITCVVNATTEDPGLHVPGLDYLKVLLCPRLSPSKPFRTGLRARKRLILSFRTHVES